MTDQTQGKSSVLELLKKVKYPGYTRDIVSFGMVQDIKVVEGKLVVQLSLINVEDKIARLIQAEAQHLLERDSGFKQVEVQAEEATSTSTPNAHSSASDDQKAVNNPLPVAGVNKIIAVSSGKGGVGKSTVAVNLACTAAQSGLRTGLLDADVYGPSLPTLLGISSKPTATSNGLVPIEKFGLKTMSIGFLVDSGQPLIWRGPIVHKALEQLLGDTHWGQLDILFVDLPPGTGDVQLTLAQKFVINGALVVTTPQDIALADVRRGAVMFQKINVPVLGIIENMSYYTCGNCGHLSHPFGEGGGQREANLLGLPLLGYIPLDPRILEQSDAGIPIVVAEPASPATREYLALWEAVRKYI